MRLDKKNHNFKKPMHKKDKVLCLEPFQDMSRCIKILVCICKTKSVDQLFSHCTADQHLCFHAIDNMMSLLSKSEISSS